MKKAKPLDLNMSPAAEAGITEALEHDPEKCAAVFGKDHAEIKELEHGDDSKGNHRALAVEKERRWKRENREKLDAWNAFLERNGLPLARYGQF